MMYTNYLSQVNKTRNANQKYDAMKRGKYFKQFFLLAESVGINAFE